MLLNIMSTSAYVLYLRYAAKHVKLSKLGSAYYNNAISLVYTLPVALYLNEFTNFQIREKVTAGLLFTLILSGVLG